VADYQMTLQGLRAERDELAIRSRDLRDEEARAALARRTTARAVAARATLLDDIDTRRDLAAQYLSELQQAYARVGPDVAPRAANGVVETVAIPLGPFRGALQWPTSGRLTGRFGQPGPAPGSVRNGIEVAAALGSPVTAIHDGVVDYAEGYTGLGTLVILNHGTNNFSVYGHLSEALVRRGESVRAGAEVGRVGPGPLDGQPTLYFELRIDGRLVDPVQWLQPR
jgi:septal ring factor EnvC (AmiA/AmiB activator)